jgi:hypothetical protein
MTLTKVDQNEIVRMRTAFSRGLRQAPVLGSCEHYNEPSDSVNGDEFFFFTSQVTISLSRKILLLYGEKVIRNINIFIIIGRDVTW